MVSRIKIGVSLLLLATLGCVDRAASTAPGKPATAPSTKLQLTSLAPAATARVAKDQPQAVTPSTTYKFGTMNLRSSESYEFEVKNVGTQPLTLKIQETSCKCTAGSVSSEPIAPGANTFVRLEWNSGSKVEPFRQFAVIRTNDPDRPEISFAVEGTVSDDYRFVPPALELGVIEPGIPGKAAEMLMFSDRNDAFTIEQLIAPPDYTATFEPLSADEVAEYGGTRGYRVKLVPPEGLEVGAIENLLYLTIQPDNAGSPPRTFEVPIEGRVAGRVSLTGSGLHAIGQGAEALRWIEMGTKSYGQGGRAKLSLKIRDEAPQLKVTKMVVEPSFLKVELVPHATMSGLYELTVEIPRDAPPCGHRGDAMGSIRLEFDHPRIKDFGFLVDFSVRPPADFP